MRLLLDTHFLAWITLGYGLTRRERALLEDPDLEVVCSAVSLWELRLKWNSVTTVGTRKGPVAPEDVVGVAETAGWTFLSLGAGHAVTALEVPLAHKDPFDELLLVQAQVEGLRLLTRDRGLLHHPLVYR